MNLKLSIITVNLNNAEGLRKTIESVVNQTYTNFEHIIIDGGSTDGSVEVIKEYEDKYTHIEGGLYWVSEPDKGIYNGMNKGIKVAKGEYCLFLNSGDWLYNQETIINSINLFNKVTHEIIYGDIIYKHDNNNSQLIKSVDRINLSFFENNSLPHPSTFIKRNLLFKLGLYNESNKVVSDYEFFLKAFINNSNTFYHINLTLTIFDTNGISNNKDFSQIREEERKEVQSKFFSKAVWQELSSYNKLKIKYDGLSQSGSVKLAIKISKFLNRIK